MLDLEERTAAVIGGSTGIGYATAALLQQRGAAVTIGGRDTQRLSDAAMSLGGDVRPVEVDATDARTLRSFFDETGPVDDLVVTVTRRGGAGAVTEVADRDLVDAFAGKPAAQLQAVALSLPTLSPTGSITLVGAA